MKKKSTKKIFPNLVFASLLFFSFSQINAQNTCATAVPIGAGTETVTIIDGTNLTTGCTFGENAEWYVYTPTENHTVTITSDLAANICKDTYFNIYKGNCNGLICFLNDDDSGTIQCNVGNVFSYLSKKTFDAFVGTSYYIAWSNRYENQGFDFQLIEQPYVAPPCILATAITAGITNVSVINGTNTTTTCSTGTAAKWYSYTATNDFKVTVTSDLPSNLCKNTNLIIYKGTCPTINCFATDDNSGVLNCSTVNPTSLLSTKTFDVATGETYYIVWDNKWSTDGFDFQLTETPLVFPIRYTNQTIPTIDTATGNYNICVVDMNNDYKDDIVGITNGNMKIHYQNANATFTKNTLNNSGNLLPNWSLAAGDYNKDGFNDIMIGNGSGTSFLKSNITGTSYTVDTPGQYIFCQRTNFIDINNDGNLDAFSCHDIAPNVYYMNDGAGNFTYNQSGVTPNSYLLGTLSSGGNYASLWTDYDNDGDQDMFISKCSGPPSELHRNDGNGIFTDISALAAINVTPIQSWSSAIDDFDNDGDMDIMIGTNGSVPNRLFKNNLDKSNTTEEAFTEITAGSGFDVNISANRDYVSYDFDNDGKVDILGSGNKIMFNQGNFVFAPTNYSSIEVGAIGDLNNDGFLDIQLGNNIKFAIPNGNNWLKIAYNGVQSNKNGIGARVEIYGAWGKQIRDVRSGEGFEFMSSLNTHFGIGTATAIEKVIIKWPSGKVDEILNPAINQTLVVLEGSTTLTNQDFILSNFRISPNPVIDQLQFSFNYNSNEIISAEIIDVSGKLISKPSINNNSIDVKQLTSGFYFLVLKDKYSKQFTSKFIKK